MSNADRKLELDKLNELIDTFNQKSQEIGLPTLKVVQPQDCRGQEKNARYFMPETFQLLVDNVKHDGRLESVPLVYEDEMSPGKYRIISGHHRIDAAKQAGLPAVIAMVIKPSGRNEIISKQLAHNSIVGQDDKMILRELYEEISTVESRIASGLTDEIKKIQYTSLNFHLGNTRDWKQVTFLFSPENVLELDQLLKDIAELAKFDPETKILACDLKHYDDFVQSLSKLKREMDIKNSATAVMLMAKITEQYLEDRKDAEEKQTDQKADSQGRRAVGEGADESADL